MTEDFTPIESGSMPKIVALCKRRGFIFPGSEIYGGVANTWDFGPLGLALKKNLKELWWREFVEKEENILGIDGGIILSPRVWEASGHVENFTDPLVECKDCHKRFRADQIDDLRKCAECHGVLTEPKKFNGMFRTFLGASEESGSVTYLRPETAQAIFINFKNVVDSCHPKLPFGIAQVGKSFRNEITAGNFIFRDLEFEQCELEYFITADVWQEKYQYWLGKMHQFARLVGLKVSEREHSPEERSHYSKKTVDLEFEYPFGKKELWGLAYRTDYDLKNHSEKSGVDLKYEGFYPHVIEPSMGVERTMLAILCATYFEDEKRVVLKFDPKLAPYKVAVFPLVKNKPELIKKAHEIYESYKTNGISVAWDDRGNIGKRYLSQDEIGTPWCVTVDYQTLEDDTVTIRDRNTSLQERIKVAKLVEEINKRLGVSS
jgi:glycyl-tRNA synthetase